MGDGLDFQAGWLMGRQGSNQSREEIFVCLFVTKIGRKHLNML